MSLLSAWSISLDSTFKQKTTSFLETYILQNDHNFEHELKQLIHIYDCFIVHF